MKTDLIEKMKYIETTYPVEDIECKGIKLWPFLRTGIFATYSHSDKENNSPSIKKKSKIKLFFEVMTMTSFFTLFKRNAAVIFTDDVGVKKNENIYVDTTMQGIFNVEIKNIPVFKKFSNKKVVPMPKYVHHTFFYIFIYLKMCFFKIEKAKIYSVDVLEIIIKELGIDIDYLKQIKIALSALSFYKFYFRLIKPIAIYVNCYYDILRMPAFYVAKKMGIPVIEQQHGIIAKRHYAYTSFVEIVDNPYPDCIFVYGNYYINQISHFIYNKRSIFPVGNYYIDLMRKQINANRSIFNEKYHFEKNRIIITVASQYDVDKETLSFVEKASDLDDNLYFIFIPRFVKDYHKTYQHDRIIIEDELDVYKCMQNSFITSTVYSTCAIESLAFGTPVVLININNLSKFGYEDFFGSIKSVFYADTPEEYVRLVYQALELDRNIVEADGKTYFSEGYMDNVKKNIAFIKETINSSNIKN